MHMIREEIDFKLAVMRKALADQDAVALRLKGIDWFAWATGGGSSAVLLAAETGVAEVLVTAREAFVLTDDIEAERLRQEEVPDDFAIQATPWADPVARDAFLEEIADGGRVLSDRPVGAELELPPELINHKRRLVPSEGERYRQVGRLASAAMTEVLNAARADWTGQMLAGMGAEALWRRGLEPALVLAAGDQRLDRWRHPVPRGEPLGRRAMLVFCARGYGLYANLTRFVSFGPLEPERYRQHELVAEIEAEALELSRPGATLRSIYHALDRAYTDNGFPNAIREHHQGGTTGYLSREVVARPMTDDVLTEGNAVAWNPSLVGAKVEDTFLIAADGSLENLTLDPHWPSVTVRRRQRPLPLER